MEKASLKVAFMAVLLVIGCGLQLRVEGSRLEKGAQNEAMMGATLIPMEEKRVQCRVPSDCIEICSGCLVNKCTAGLCVCGC